MIDNKEYVICPICNEKKRILQTQHLRKHGYNSVKEFLNDYPGTVTCSEYFSNKSKVATKDYWNKEENRKKQSDKFKEVAKTRWTPEEREKYSKLRKEMWNDESYRSSTSKARWTEENRKILSERNVEMNKRLLSDPEYYEMRAKQYASIGHKGQKTFYNGKHLKSSYELFVCKYLDEETSINYEYEFKGFNYIDPNDNKVHKYFPDLYIKEINQIIEIKPKFLIDNETVKAKMKAIIDKGYKFKFLTEENFDNLKEFFESLFEGATTIENVTDKKSISE